MHMIDNINCVQYGYNPKIEIPPAIQDADPDEDDIFNDEEELLLDKMRTGIMKKR